MIKNRLWVRGLVTRLTWFGVIRIWYNNIRFEVIVRSLLVTIDKDSIIGSLIFWIFDKLDMKLWFEFGDLVDNSDFEDLILYFVNREGDR